MNINLNKMAQLFTAGFFGDGNYLTLT